MVLKFVLYQLPTIIAALYAILEHYGYIDKLTGRKYALEGAARLKSGAGYPTTWIYDDEEASDGQIKDSVIFNALYKRIKKKTTAGLSDPLQKGYTPTLIVTGGVPIEITRVPEYWGQEARFYYSQSHPVMVLFNAYRSKSNGTALRVCSIAELNDWLGQEKDNRKLWVGVVCIAVLSCVLFFMRGL
jgi:hypothetical protein